MLELQPLVYGFVQLLIMGASAAVSAYGAYSAASARNEQEAATDRAVSDQNIALARQEKAFNRFNEEQGRVAKLTDRREQRLANISRRLTNLKFQEQTADFRQARRENIRQTIAARGATNFAFSQSGAGLGSSALGGAQAATTVQSATNEQNLQENFGRARTVFQLNRQSTRTSNQFNRLIGRASRRAAAAQSLINTTDRDFRGAASSFQQTNVLGQTRIAEGNSLFNAGIQTLQNTENISNVLNTTFGTQGS